MCRYPAVVVGEDHWCIAKRSILTAHRVGRSLVFFHVTRTRSDDSRIFGPVAVLEARGDPGVDGCMLWTPNSPQIPPLAQPCSGTACRRPRMHMTALKMGISHDAGFADLDCRSSVWCRPLLDSFQGLSPYIQLLETQGHPRLIAPIIRWHYCKEGLVSMVAEGFSAFCGSACADGVKLILTLFLSPGIRFFRSIRSHTYWSLCGIVLMSFLRHFCFISVFYCTGYRAIISGLWATLTMEWKIKVRGKARHHQQIWQHATLPCSRQLLLAWRKAEADGGPSVKRSCYFCHSESDHSQRRPVSHVSGTGCLAVELLLRSQGFSF